MKANELDAAYPHLTPEEQAELDALLACEPPALESFVAATTGFSLEAWQLLVCRRLEQLLDQTGQRVLIHGPPQYGKSIVISQRFPAYAIGRKPTHRLRVACYNVTHAERFSKVNLELMRDPDYIRMFPGEDARVPAICPADEWSTAARAAKRDANPSFKALGLGTGFTGLGVDILVVDDPYKNAQDARSEAINAQLWDWWTQVVYPRLNPATNVVVMFHRWWEGDFAGRLLEQGGWEQLRFPAIADGHPHDPTGRRLGELLSPRYPRAYLDDLRRTMGTAFEALYQGTPFPVGGAMFRANKVSYLDVSPATITGRVRAWDLGASDGTGDYTVGVLMSRTPQGRYVVEDVQRGQWGSDERDEIILKTAERDKARFGPGVRIRLPQDPGQAGKSQALHFTRLLAGYVVETAIESGDKVTRADPFASQWNGGNVDLVRGAWNEAYVAEHLAFPQGKHDDQVDPSGTACSVLAQVVPSNPTAGGSRQPAPASRPQIPPRGGLRT